MFQSSVNNIVLSNTEYLTTITNSIKQLIFCISSGTCICHLLAFKKNYYVVKMSFILKTVQLL